MSEPSLFQWPTRAKYGRVVPKSKFYEQGASTKIRERFVAEVHRIRWAYKLAEETVQLAGDAAVPEIQVFEVEAKAGEVSEPVLAAMDKSIPYPLIFEISRDHPDKRQTRMTACCKQLGERKPNLGPYCTSPWFDEPVDRQPLPAALDLQSLYRGVLSSIWPFTAHSGETLWEMSNRLSLAYKLQREILALERRLRGEAQFNRKVDVRRQLRALTAELEILTDPDTSESKTQTKDPQWTS